MVAIGSGGAHAPHGRQRRKFASGSVAHMLVVGRVGIEPTTKGL